MPLPMILSLLVHTLLVTSAGPTLPADSIRPTGTRADSTARARGSTLLADSLVVEKKRRQLVLYYRGVPLRTYYVALGRSPVGDKVQIGDNRTPEGVFRIDGRNPNSRFHLSLRISYPDSTHRARAIRRGYEPGGDIMIHGLPPEQSALGPAHRDFDWTNGCIAVTNAEIEELWEVVRDGTPIQIKP